MPLNALSLHYEGLRGKLAVGLCANPAHNGETHSVNGQATMTSSVRSIALLCALLGMGAACNAAAQAQAPLLISTEERCAFNRVDDESLALALKNCTRMAEADDMQAQFEMGELYYHGERTHQDIAAALQWYERASILGHPDAQYRLGLMHMAGEGVERSLPQAYIMLKMAAVNGQNAAMDASDRLTEEMTDEEIAAATQALGTLFRNYLRYIRDEQLQRLQPGNNNNDLAPAPPSRF